MKSNFIIHLGLILILNIGLVRCGVHTNGASNGSTSGTSTSKIEEPEFPENEPPTLEQFNELKNQVSVLSEKLEAQTKTLEQRNEEFRLALSQRLDGLDSKLVTSLAEQDQRLQKRMELSENTLAILSTTNQELSKKLATQDSQVLALAEKMKSQKSALDTWMSEKDQQLKSLAGSQQEQLSQMAVLKADGLKLGETIKTMTALLEEAKNEFKKGLQDFESQNRSSIKEAQNKYDELVQKLNQKLSETKTLRENFEQNKLEQKNEIVLVKAEFAESIKVSSNDLNEKIQAGSDFFKNEIKNLLETFTNFKNELHISCCSSQWL